MIGIAIQLDTFHTLQAFTKGGFSAEYKTYQDHAVIMVDKEVLCELMKQQRLNETLDAVILRKIKEYLREDA